MSIVYAASGRYEKAVIATVVAILLDGLDGRVARRLKATSKFGVEFDSFADLISFGLAPAFLMYEWCFKAMADEFGVFICFVYVLCAASRLVRFNITEKSLSAFQGLPSPAAAAMMVSLVNIDPTFIVGKSTIAGLTVIVLVVAYLMVSNIEFLSIKQVKINRYPLFVRLLLFAIIPFTWYMPRAVFVVISALFCLSGLAVFCLRRLQAGDSENSNEELKSQA